MKECLKCKRDIADKHESAKFCSTSCRVMWNRNPANKKEKGLTELQQMKVLYDALIDKIDKIGQPQTISPAIWHPQNTETALPLFIEKPKIAIKRTPPHWVELRRDCENADDYAKWLEDLENDPYLTAREKQQIKQTT